MDEASGIASNLYERVLGSTWGQLHESVRRAHATRGVMRGKGSFSVVHGQTPFARFLVRMLALPPPTPFAHVSLEVVSHANGETWVRKFEEKRVVTEQRRGPGNLLVETIGCLEFRFGLAVGGGGIRYNQRVCGLRLGGVFIPLPSWLSPKVEAWEQPAQCPDNSSSAVLVKVSAPIAGLVVQYEGEIRIETRAT